MSQEPAENNFAMDRVFAGMKRDIERSFRRTGGFGKLWSDIVPGELGAASTIQSYARGVLTVAVNDAAAMYEIDRLLRSGLEQQLRERAPSTLKRVKLILTG